MWIKSLACVVVLSTAPLAQAGLSDHCGYTQIAEFAVQFRGPQLAPTVMGAINDTPVRFVVDTGASATTILPAGIDRLALPVTASGKTMVGIGGVASMGAAGIRSMSLSGLAMVTAPATLPVLKESASPSRFDALLGANHLLKNDVEINLDNGVIRLLRPETCERAAVPHAARDVSVIPFERRDGRPTIVVDVNRIRMRAVLDTGADISTVDQAAAVRAGLDMQSATVSDAGLVAGAGARPMPRWTGRFAQVRVGERVDKDVDLSITDMSGTGFDMVLGRDFMRAHTIVIAARERLVYLDRTGTVAFDPKGLHMRAWLEKQAQRDNADAIVALSRKARSRAEWHSLVARAAELGDPWANSELAIKARQAGRGDQAQQFYERALQADPAYFTALRERFLARYTAGDRDAARAQLEASTASLGTAWPQPVIAFLVGRLSADDLLAAARQHPVDSSAKICQAAANIGSYVAIAGQSERLAALVKEVGSGCPRLSESWSYLLPRAETVVQ